MQLPVYFQILRAFKLNVIYLQRIKARRDWGKTVPFCSINWILTDAASSSTRPLMREMPYSTGSGALFAKDSLHTPTCRCLPCHLIDQIIWRTNTAICRPKSFSCWYNLSTVFENQTSTHFLLSITSILLLTLSKWLQQLLSVQLLCS